MMDDTAELSKDELLRSCLYGSLQDVQALFTPELKDALDSNGKGAMHAACHNKSVGDLEMAKWLHEQGVALDTRSKVGRPPIHDACETGNLEIAQWMHENGAAIDTANNFGIHTIHCACKSGNLALVQYVVAKSGASVNLADSGGGTPMLFAAAGAESPSVEASLQLCQWLHAQGAKLDCKNKADVTPLKHAENGQKTKLMEWIKTALEHEQAAPEQERDVLITETGIGSNGRCCC